MIPLLSSLAPDRLWLFLLIPLLVALYLWMMQRKRNRSMQMSKTMFDLVIPHRSALGYGMLQSAGRSSAC
jgi:Ca-activated chloride channel homolog